MTDDEYIQRYSDLKKLEKQVDNVDDPSKRRSIEYMIAALRE